MTQTATTARLFTAYAAAVRKMVSNFSTLDHDAVKGMHRAFEGEDAFLPMPMWGTCFLVTDSVDQRRIREMLVSFEPTTVEEAQEMVSDYGLGVDLGDFVDTWDNEDGETDSALDEDLYIEAVIDAWREGDFEVEILASAGWQKVGETGLLALDLDGDELILGINGAGFSFYGNVETGDRTGIWARLYDALGYEWHHGTFREAVVEAAVRALCATETCSVEEDAAILTLRKAQANRLMGGPLTSAEIEFGESVNPSN